jgi:hypothetical protein
VLAQCEQPGAHESCSGRPTAVPDVEHVQRRREVGRVKLPDKCQAGDDDADQQSLPQDGLNLDACLASHALADEQAQCHGGEHEQQRVRQYERADHKDVIQRAAPSMAGSNSRVRVTIVSSFI